MNPLDGFESFKREYFRKKGKNLDTGTSREFVYECLTEGIYNTELVLCREGVKPVSRFIVEKEVHGQYLRDWALKSGMEFDFRPLSPNENRANLNPRIRYVGYFSKTPGLVAEAMDADANAKDDFEYRIGKLLGYPECCNFAWSRAGNIPREKDRIGFFFDRYVADPEPENVPFLNFTQRSLSFFYPCSLSCGNALEVHRRQAEAIRKDAPEFHGEILRFRSYPTVFFGPKKSETLSLNLHFDEMFRIHFVGKRISEDTVAYADFFLSSLSFLDQTTEPEYARNCIRLLQSVLEGDNLVIDDESFVVRSGKRTIYKAVSGDFSRISVLSCTR